MTSNTSILDMLQQHLGPDTIANISQQLGASPADVSSGIAAALPVLLSGLHRNASDPQGAAALDSALNAHDGSILDNLGSLLGGGATGGIGAAILAHILGKRQAPVEEGVSRASGLSAQQVSQLLMMLAPIVMGVLGRMRQQKGLSPAQLPEVLGQSKAQMEAQNPALGGLASVLDSNHDGQIADDVMRIGSSMLGGLFGKRP
ncbi:MAG TPA: DUF937 domain-containing protein [Thermoanaerobaculia bacterium]|nr:DUF937 domain-containing protein [Thermoanaerobaculia bacterium]